MKLLLSIAYLCLAGFHVALSAAENDDFKVILEPMWKDLENNEKKAEEFGGKWILAGSITFKKRAKDTLHLNKIYLQWRGAPIENLVASLYYKEDDEKFLPIQSNLICDGTWNRGLQTLLLDFEEKKTLGPTNIYYLVLTVPNNLEIIIKDGSFNLLPNALPEPYKVVTKKRKFSLAYNNLPALKDTHFALNPSYATQVTIDVVEATHQSPNR